MLIHSGFQVHTANNGAQALLQVKSHDYDGVVMDIGLPDQDGCVVAIQIRSWQQDNHRPISIIVALSAHLDEEGRQRCLAAGMVSAFLKPLDVEKVREISDLLNTEQRDPACLMDKKNLSTWRSRRHG